MSVHRGRADGLIAWSRREPWGERLRITTERHLRSACDAYDIDIVDLPEIVGDLAFAALDCVFEDACTIIWEDEKNLVDEYLRRRGWKESAVNRAYLQALRDSVMSLYEVSDVRRGESFLARDLIRGGEPIRIADRTLTQTLVDWDVIAVRIITVRGERQLTSPVLAIEQEVGEEIFAGVQNMRERVPLVSAAITEVSSPQQRKELLAELTSDDAILRMIAPVVTSLWLEDAIGRILEAPQMSFANPDGEPLELLILRYALAPTATREALSAALARVPHLYEDEEGAGWTLFAPPAAGSGSREPADAFDAIEADLRLAGGALEGFVTSRAQCERVRGVIEPALADLVGEPTIEPAPLDGLDDKAPMMVPPAMEMPEGIEAADVHAAIHGLMDRHYEETLGKPLQVFGGKSPRQAARSKAGRVAVVRWLKNLERNARRRPQGDPMQSYDFTWMWEALRVSDLRV